MSCWRHFLLLNCSLVDEGAPTISKADGSKRETKEAGEILPVVVKVQFMTLLC